jgi:hypothetical protein
MNCFRAERIHLREAYVPSGTVADCFYSFCNYPGPLRDARCFCSSQPHRSQSILQRDLLENLDYGV